ncbi:Blp family class II bacteriocin [Alteromonas genovensis]|uniref:Blp family class II bacteriocin n=1 Tax=Alteromonas genovensis TaxID=471225 RepID=UPI002FE2CBEA
MQLLDNDEISKIAGGCSEHCWGDFSMAGLASAIVAGGIGGIRGGIGGALIGGLAGALGYSGSKIGDTMSKRST